MEPVRETQRTRVTFAEDQLKGLISTLASLLSVLSPKSISTPEEQLIPYKKYVKHAVDVAAHTL